MPQSDLPDFAQEFYARAAAGLLLDGLPLFLRSRYLLFRPEARKKAQVKEQDERETTIVNSAFCLAGLITFFGSAGVLFIVLPLSQPAFAALLAVMVVYALAFWAGNLYCSKKL